MYVNNCAYCGNEYKAQRSTSIYCSARCRKAANRAQCTVRSIDTTVRGNVTFSPRLTEKQVSATFVNLKGIAATLDAASMTAPERYRDVCRVVSVDIRNSLKKVGL